MLDCGRPLFANAIANELETLAAIVLERGRGDGSGGSTRMQSLSAFEEGDSFFAKRAKIEHLAPPWELACSSRVPT